MRSEDRNAQSDGSFTIGSGNGLRAVPLKGAAWSPLTLKLEREGQPLQTLVYEPGQVVYPAPWTNASVSGAVAGSQWRVQLAEQASEKIEPAPREPVLLLQGLIGGELANGAYYLTTRVLSGTGFFGLSTTAEQSILLDVRTVGALHFNIHAPPVVGYGAQTIAVFLDCWDDAAGQTANYNAEPAGSGNNFASAGDRFGSIVLGNTTDASGTLEKRHAVRYSYVRPRIVFGGGPTELDGFMVLTMRALP